MFTNAELADAHLMYGLARGNSRGAVRLYRDRFPERRCPDRKTFDAIDRRLREHGTFQPMTRDWGRPRTTRTPAMDEAILRAVDDNPNVSAREVAAVQGNVDHVTVWRVLRENLLFPYHVQRVQALSAADWPPRVHFCEWFIQQCVNPHFSANVLFTDEASFQRDQIVNFHNQHVWADENPHAIVQSRHQHRFSVNVWAGIVGDVLIGPHVLPPTLNGARYHDFIRDTLPVLLEHVPLQVRHNMWFMHDGAPAHFSRSVRTLLNNRFGDRWIGRGGPLPWPPRSPDLNPLDFHLWGHLKALVYATPVPNVETLRARIVDGCDTIRQSPGLHQRIRDSMRRRVDACILANGGHFEHFL